MGEPPNPDPHVDTISLNNQPEDVDTSQTYRFRTCVQSDLTKNRLVRLGGESIGEENPEFSLLKRYDTRPLPLWRMPIKEERFKIDEKIRCGMKDVTLEIFICTQIDSCPYECTQKLDQMKENGKVKERQLNVRNQILEMLKMDNLLRNGRA